MDRLLPVDCLYWQLAFWAALRSLFPTRWLERGPVWPACLGTNPGRSSWLRSLHHHLDRLPAFLPDRLSGEKWRDRCEISGLGHLEAARHEGRPVVLAFCHFGPIVLISHWLRSRGLPAIPLVVGFARNRPYIHRLRDRYLPFPDIPGALYTDQMREVASLGGEAALLIALDARASKTVNVPVAPGWQFRLATGAIRLAAQKRALLIPCTLLRVGPWRFRIELGQPVPEAFLGPNPDLAQAGAHLIAELFPHQLAHPDHCFRELLGSFSPAPAPDIGNAPARSESCQ